MGEIVNLSRARKARDRKAAAEQAAANRIAFGRTRAQREQPAEKRRHLDARLDGARLERDGEPGE